MDTESENVARSRRVFATINSEGIEAALPDIDPEFEMTTPADLAAEPGTFSGHAGIKRWWDSFYEVMEEIRIEPSELRDAGRDHVAIAFTLSAKGRTSGLEFNQQSAMMTTLREGRLLRIEYFPSIDEAEAEGLSRENSVRPGG